MGFFEGRDDVADDAEARQDQDVDLGVAEEPEQVLEHHRVAAARRVEEAGAEVAVGQQHGDGAGQHRQRQQQQEDGDQDRPHEQRHAVQSHARGAHVEDGGDEIDRA